MTEATQHTAEAVHHQQQEVQAIPTVRQAGVQEVSEAEAIAEEAEVPADTAEAEACHAAVEVPEQDDRHIFV